MKRRRDGGGGVALAALARRDHGIPKQSRRTTMTAAGQLKGGGGIHADTCARGESWREKLEGGLWPWHFHGGVTAFLNGTS